MLKFFRRHQRICFIFVTAIIVISFSFFGSYSMLGNLQQPHDPVAFTAIDGSPVKLSELYQMTSFISTDAEDAMRYGSAAGMNFLNDGVVRNDILHTGMGSIIGVRHLSLLAKDLETRETREQRFQPYRHPSARFLSAEAAWASFAPKLKGALDGFLDATTVSARGFEKRVNLYLAEQRFPQETLKKVIRAQETEVHSAPDPYLEQRDLSLFGYHTLEDWFGQRFLSLVAQVIINGSILAEQRGYQVSDKEVWMDLLHRTRLASSHLGQAAAGVDDKALLEAQLHRLRLDRAAAISLWKRVMLFRRLFQESGSLPLVDTLGFDRIARFSGEVADIAIYRLPESFRLKSVTDLVELECYLDAVSERRELFALPTHVRSKEAILQANPELVQKRFLVRLGEVDHLAAARRLTVRELLDWELEEENFHALAAEFPTILGGEHTTRADRHQALSFLDKEMRSALDTLAKRLIVKAHPEWITEDLENAPRQTVTLAITEWGGKFPLQGIIYRRDLRKALETSDRLACYSQDGRTSYAIDVLDRDQEESVLTFEEARQLGVLGDLVETRLKTYYDFLREGSPLAYTRPDGRAKSLEEVRREVGEKMLAPLITSIHTDALAAKQLAVPNKPSGEFATYNRFAHYLRSIRDTLYMTQKEDDWLATPAVATSPDRLPPRAPLSQQWKILRETRSVARTYREVPGLAIAFDLKAGEWSPLMTEGKMGSYFFKLLSKDAGVAQIAPEKLQASQKMLASEAQRQICQTLLDEMDLRGDMKLDEPKEEV